MEKKIINTCNTCRSPIHEGEILWHSQTGQSSGKTVGAYGGANTHVNQNTSVHGGTYGAHHSSEHSSENWIQCGWYYDQWQGEIIENDKWKKTPNITNWAIVFGITAVCSIISIILGYYFAKEKNVTDFTKPVIAWGVIGLVGGFILGFGAGTKPAYPEPSKPDRYRFRKRPTIL